MTLFLPDITTETMAAVAKEADLTSDEEWLVYKAHECLKSDPHAAKAWLMTAKSLFPRNFDIQVFGRPTNIVLSEFVG